MKILFYKTMRYICWILEDIHDCFSNNYRFYPSFYWEEKQIEEINKRGK